MTTTEIMIIVHGLVIKLNELSWDYSYGNLGEMTLYYTLGQIKVLRETSEKLLNKLNKKLIQDGKKYIIAE